MRVVAALIFIFGQVVYAEECTTSNCRSQLIRLDINSQVVSDLFQSNPEVRSSSLEALQTYVNSDSFSESFETNYAIPNLAFPHNSGLCEMKRQSGNELYQGLDCLQENLCANQEVSEQIRNELCLSFPCSFLKGDINQCPSSAPNGSPAQITFPNDVVLKDIEIEPLDINFEGNTLSGCFNVNKLDVEIDINLDMAPNPEIDYQSMGINNIALSTTEPRRVCATMQVNLGSENPISNIQITRGDERFVTSSAIQNSIQNAELYGVDGYSPAARSVFRLSVLTPMARYFQDPIEDAIEGSLAQAFEASLASYLSSASTSEANFVIEPPSSITSELGVSNMMVEKYAELLECSIIKDRRQSIEGHSCLEKSYSFGSDPLNYREVPSTRRSLRYLRDQVNRFDNLTSESLRLRLESFRGDLSEDQFSEYIAPIINEINANQARSNFISGVEVFTDFQTQQDTQSLGVGLAGICNTELNSPHHGRSIPNCQAQVYVDTNELNRLMQAMYNDGRMCHRGQGDFVPELNSRGEQVYRDRFAQGSGCVFQMEEKENGLRCYLNGAPELAFDQVSGRYMFQLRTKHCYRGSVILGQGRIGGDIDFDISYNPAICENGVLCLQDGQAQWNVVPGSERYALRSGSFLNGTVHNQINSQLTEMVSDTVRIAFTDGILSQMPIRAGAQLDTGEGFFGVCLDIVD